VAHLLVGVLEGEGGGGAILPRLGAEVVVEAGAGGHGLGVEVGGERAVLHQAGASVSAIITRDKAAMQPGSAAAAAEAVPSPTSTTPARSSSSALSTLAFRGRSPPRDPPEGGGGDNSISPVPCSSRPQRSNAQAAQATDLVYRQDDTERSCPALPPGSHIPRGRCHPPPLRGTSLSDGACHSFSWASLLRCYVRGTGWKHWHGRRVAEARRPRKMGRGARTSWEKSILAVCEETNLACKGAGCEWDV